MLYYLLLYFVCCLSPWAIIYALQGQSILFSVVSPSLRTVPSSISRDSGNICGAAEPKKEVSQELRNYWGQTKTLKHQQASLLGKVATAWESCLSVPALGSEISLQTSLGYTPSLGIWFMILFIITKCVIWLFLGMGRVYWLISMFIWVFGTGGSLWACDRLECDMAEKTAV